MCSVKITLTERPVAVMVNTSYNQNSWRNKAPLAVGLGLFLLASAGAYALLQPDATQAAEQKAPTAVLTVSVAPAQMTSLTQTLQVSGSVAPWQQLTVGSEVGGLKIEQVNTDEGQRVTKGQVLVVLNSDVLRTQLTQAQARVNTAKAQVQQQKALLTQARARAFESKLNLKSAEELKKAGAISDQDLRGRRSTDQANQAAVNQVQEAITSAQSTVAEAQATIGQYQAQLSKTRIIAPDDGLVLSKSVFIGSISDVGKAMLTLARQSRLELNAQVPETDLPKLQTGQLVQIVSDADAQLHTQGRIRLIGPTVDATSRQAIVKVTLNANPRLRSGMFVRGRVNVAQAQVLTVPAQAVSVRDDKAQLFVLGSGNTVQLRTVQLGERSAQRIAIKSGLKAGEQVVTSGAGYLKDGDVVKVSSLTS